MPASPPILAVTWDLDGTLYATGPHRRRLALRLLPQLPLIRAWQEAVGTCRRAPGADLPRQIAARTAERLGCAEEEAEARLWFFLERTWIPALRSAHVPPAVQAALTLLDARGVPRAVASDHPAWGKLRALGLAEGWQAVLDGETVGALKPAPELILAAAQALGVAPAHLLHVGDRTDTDGAAAEAAGARFLHAIDGGRPLPERLADALDGRETP